LHSMRQLLDWYGDGKLQPHISQVLPLAQGGEALQILMDRQAQGKVVLQIR
ncbi:MAG: zinc-binding dehydrogenase, partial [Anaerolineales bacterium]|nr:zinc-binding dehydrogenase [Anaerolineales bacterium]